MLVEVAGKRYPLAKIDDLSLGQATQLQFELRSGAYDSMTSIRTMDELSEFVGRWGNQSREERELDPDTPFLQCIVVWASMTGTGQEMSLKEAVFKTPTSSVRFLSEPSDRQVVAGPKARTGQSGHARSAPRKRKGKRKH